MDFLGPFVAGWLAHRENPDIAKDDGEAFMRLAMEAYERSGPVLAWKVANGELTEAEARESLMGDYARRSFLDLDQYLPDV